MTQIIIQHDNNRLYNMIEEVDGHCQRLCVDERCNKDSATFSLTETAASESSQENTQ